MTREVEFNVDLDDVSLTSSNITFRVIGGGEVGPLTALVEDGTATSMTRFELQDNNEVYLESNPASLPGSPINLADSVTSDPEMIRLALFPPGEDAHIITIPGPRFPQLDDDPLAFSSRGAPLAPYRYTFGASSVGIVRSTSISASDPIADFIRIANEATNPAFRLEISNRINDPEFERDKFLRMSSTGDVEEALSRAIEGDDTTSPSYRGNIPSLSEGGRFHEEVMPLGVKSVTVKAISEGHLAGDFVYLSIHPDDGYLRTHYANDNYAAENVQGFVLEDSNEFTETTVYLSGINHQFSGLTPGMPVYVNNEGRATHTAPTDTGRYVHYVGQAISSTSVWFNPTPSIELE